MKFFVLQIALFCFLSLSANPDLSQLEFYQTIASESAEEIEKALMLINEADATQSIYNSALLIKKASYLKVLKEKIELCKEGIKGLEASIEEHPENAEFRFIRLSIQENAPKILKYKLNLEEDKTFLLEKFSSLDADLQVIIKNYAKSSMILTSDDF